MLMYTDHRLIFFSAYRPGRFFPGSFAVDRVPHYPMDWAGDTLSKDGKPVPIWITGTLSSYEKQGCAIRVSIQPYDKTVLFHTKKLLNRYGKPGTMSFKNISNPTLLTNTTYVRVLSSLPTAPDVFSSDDTITMAGSMAVIPWLSWTTALSDLMPTANSRTHSLQ